MYVPKFLLGPYSISVVLFLGQSALLFHFCSWSNTVKVTEVAAGRFYSKQIFFNRDVVSFLTKLQIVDLAALFNVFDYFLYFLKYFK